MTDKTQGEAAGMQRYVRLLACPPKDARGWTRWWWFGCAVTKKEIRRELEAMQQAGLGGVEIQILYPLVADDAAAGIGNIPYFSPDFFEIMRYTVETAHELGLGVDYTLGSSWPYGGPFLPKDMSAQPAVLLQIDVSGPIRDYSYDFTTRVSGEIVCVTMGKTEHSRMLPETVRDITHLLTDKELFGWPWGKVLHCPEIPEGDWKISALVVGGYRQLVSIPTRGAQGYVMDHCRRDVTDFFLKNAAQPLLDRLGRGCFDHLFCDSIELSGNNWTKDLPKEFEKRRGYALEPYIYALWGELDCIGDRVRYDYYKTMSELTNENFFSRLTQWCHSHGLQSRIQAHGIWADILQAYACADVPEGESFGEQDKLFLNTIHRRLASSAAHVYGRQIVSNESFTVLRKPRFLVTLEMLKAAADAIFLDGMNRLVNHGYAYSPDEAGRLGWPFYVSSHLNHTNPLWPCYSAFGEYVQRVSALLQQGTACNDVAVYLPQADIWSENPMCDLHMAMKLQEHFGWDVPDRICRAGYSFDYVNDEALQKLADMRGGMVINGNTYHILLLIGCTRLPAETALKIEEFVQNGGILLASEAAPSRSCGLKDYRVHDAAVRDCMGRLFSGEKGVWQQYGHGWTAVAPDRRNALLSLLSQQRKPDVLLSCPDRVGYQHRSVPEGDIYFLANLSDRACNLTASFCAQASHVSVWNACSAQQMKASIACKGGRTCAGFELEPFGSAFVFFSRTDTGTFTAEDTPSESLPLSGPWTLEIAEKGFRCVQKEPRCWQQYEPVRLYSGFGSYETQFTLTDRGICRAELILEHVYTSARVYLNGDFCGILWKRPWKLDVTAQLTPGKNTLKIVCGNQLFNCALDPANEPVPYDGTLLDGWPYFTETINQIRARRISLVKERESGLPPQPSGIEGTVFLKIWKEK